MHIFKKATKRQLQYVWYRLSSIKPYTWRKNAEITVPLLQWITVQVRLCIRDQITTPPELTLDYFLYYIFFWSTISSSGSSSMPTVTKRKTRTRPVLEEVGGFRNCAETLRPLSKRLGKWYTIRILPGYLPRRLPSAWAMLFCSSLDTPFDPRRAFGGGLQ